MMCGERLRVALALACLLSSPLTASAGPGPRPPRLGVSPRHFARDVRPIQPRTSAGLTMAHIWGGTRRGVQLQQLAMALSGELAYKDRIGAFVELPLLWEAATTEGVLGPGSAAAVGLGDLRFGVDWAVHSFAALGWRWQVGLGVQASAPTSGLRRLEPDTPVVAVPPVELGPSRWTASLGPSLALSTPWGLGAQLNADALLNAHVEGERWLRDPRLFGAVAATISYRLNHYLEPLLMWDFIFELYGQLQLRQLIFVSPALRVRPHARVAVDLGLRIPVRQESRIEQHVAVGLTVSFDLGNKEQKTENRE